MPTTLLLSPAATGKTHLSIARVQAALQATPLAEVWVILPDHNQAASFTRRLADAGGALGARVVTFADLFAELSMHARMPRAVASDQIVARLIRRAIDDLAARNLLPHYARIHALPGFARAAADLIAEWKRAHVSPARLTSAVQARGQWLRELAAIFDQYERTLNTMGWTDAPGLGWQTIDALGANPALASDWPLLVVDGFDSFTPLALETLRLLAGRAQETLVTLTGDAHMTRPAYRRFARTFEQLRAALNPQVETLAPHLVTIPALAHLQQGLFETAASQLAGAAAVQFLEARTPALEAREALRWLKFHIVRDGVLPDQCALIARDLPSYRPYLREAAAEFGLPLRFLGSEPLSSSALVAAIMDVLRLPLRNWPRRALLDALRTPYFDLSFCKLSARDAALFDEVAYAGQIIEGIEPWEIFLSALAENDRALLVPEDEEAVVSRPSGVEARRLLDGLRVFVARLNLPGGGSLIDHVRWVERLLFAADGLGVQTLLAATADTAHADREALKAFVESLGALVSMEAALGTRTSVSYEQFVTELQTAVDGADYQPDEPESLRPPRIYAGNMNTTRGVPYTALVILGLSEGIFPSPLSPDPFMPDAEIEYLRAQGLSLEPRLRSDQQTLFYEAVSRASRFLLLTRPYLADDGERWEPSPYWSEAQKLFEKQEPMRVRDTLPRDTLLASSTSELVCSLVALDTLPQGYHSIEPAWQAARYAGQVLRARMSHAAAGAFEGMASGLAARLKHRATTQPWSASRLEAYATCPYYFFTSSSLALTLRETPAVGYQPHQLGSMLHAALEEVYKSVGADCSLERLLAALDEVLPLLFAAAPSKYHFRASPLWKVEKQQLTELLRETLAGLAAVDAGFQPRSLEQKFGFDAPGLILQTDSGPITLRGIIDRIDVNAQGGLRVIDYKTGASGLQPDDLIEGKRLQLPIYALAAEQPPGSGQAVDGFYWPIREAEPGRLRLESFHYEAHDGRVYAGPRGAIALAQEYVRAYIAQIVDGRFAPAAPRDGCPNYCPARRYCWRYTPSRIP